MTEEFKRAKATKLEHIILNETSVPHGKRHRSAWHYSLLDANKGADWAYEYCQNKFDDARADMVDFIQNKQAIIDRLKEALDDIYDDEGATQESSRYIVQALIDVEKMEND